MPRTLCSLLTACLALTLTLGFSGAGEAQQTGQLDPNFGSGGKVVLDWTPVDPVSEAARAVATQADGKMVIVGDALDAAGPSTSSCVVVRTSADGTVDTSFGSNGRVLLDFTPTYDFAF